MLIIPFIAWEKGLIIGIIQAIKKQLQYIDLGIPVEDTDVAGICLLLIVGLVVFMTVKNCWHKIRKKQKGHSE